MFEQQKEILLLQECDKIKHELKMKKQLVLDQLGEKVKLDLEGYPLSMIRDGMLSTEDQGGQIPRRSEYLFDT